MLFHLQSNKWMYNRVYVYSRIKKNKLPIYKEMKTKKHVNLAMRGNVMK